MVDQPGGDQSTIAIVAALDEIFPLTLSNVEALSSACPLIVS
jgi:hypothetical protein